MTHSLSHTPTRDAKREYDYVRLPDRILAALPPQERAVYDYLLAGRSLTNQIALNSLGVSSVTRRITELRRRGLFIESAWSRDHFGQRYVKYRLIPAEALEQEALQ